jgi:hypothetical protein
MLRSNLLRFRIWLCLIAALICFCRAARPAQQQEAPVYNVNIVVTDAASGDPISQAKLTLGFQQPGKLHRNVTYGAKTNAQGKYRFTDIPKGTVHLFVTAERHQSFGKEIEIEEDNQVIEVKLKKPQPLL